MSYLNKEPQVDILGLRLGPVDLAVLFVRDVDALEDIVSFRVTSIFPSTYYNCDILRFCVK